jgi:hypothetical protein
VKLTRVLDAMVFGVLASHPPSSTVFWNVREKMRWSVESFHSKH